jgi:hypothetical protein
MPVTMESLGIDRLSVEDREDLVRQIRASLGAEPGPPSLSLEWSASLTALRKLGRLPDDWDQCGSVAPTVEVVERVADILTDLSQGPFPPPDDFSVGGAGEITACWWFDGGGYFEMRVARPDHVRWMASWADRPSQHGEGYSLEARQVLGAMLKPD